MFDPDEQHSEVPRYERHQVLIMTILSELFVLLVASLWIYFGKVDLRSLIGFTPRALAFGIGGGVLVTAINIGLWRLSEKYGDKNYLLQSMKDLIDKQMLPLMGNLTFFDSILVAAVSGLSEEVFFRGVLQTQCGIISSACAFGLAHLPRIYYFPYALWATYVGLFMSFLVLKTNSLYAPVIAHALINLASINILRYIQKRRGGGI